MVVPKKKRLVLLSELYQAKGPLLKATLGLYRNQVASIAAQSTKTKEDTFFVNDFLNKIVDLKIMSEPVPQEQRRGQQVNRLTAAEVGLETGA